MLPGGNAYPKITGEDEPVRPEETTNTPEQDAIAESVTEQIEAGTANITIDGVANNIVIPADAPKSLTLTGEFQSGCTITNESSKTLTIDNTSAEPIDIIIDSPASVTLKGEYNNVWANTKNVYGQNGTKARISSITFDPELEGTGNLSVYADWKTPVTVTSYNTNNLTINNSSDDTVLEEITIVAPNATVTLTGLWGDVTGTFGNDTLILTETFHADQLNVLKGNVIVYNCFPEQVADEINLADGVTMKPFEYSAPADGTNLRSNAGIYTITEAINSKIQTAIATRGNFKYINNGSVTTNSTSAMVLIRSNCSMYFEGDGRWENTNGYGIWKSSNDGEVVINSGEFIAQTSAVYAEKGFVKIYGGTFKVSDEDKKYLLNCLDSTYTAGTSGIQVYGGKFYGFNPAEAMSEPGAPVSFVMEGYKSVEVEEGVWEVVPED